MPLPPDCTLSLLTQALASETVSSKSRQAMIVRMSAETLDALESACQRMDVEMSDHPGIFIGETFFPMRPSKEDTSHELYIRTPSAAKQMVPLRLYANVTGKFIIEPELGDRMKDRIREVTVDAAKQRDRRVKLIDNPPELLKTNKKKRREPPTMFRNAIRPSDQTKSTASTSSSVVSTLPHKQTNMDETRKRLVHCIAVAERTRDQVIKMVGGLDCDASLRREVLDLLERVAEPTSPIKKDEDLGLKTWRLKTESWLEVRPYEWPKLTEAERVSMARTGRQKLGSLRIPETDPAWNHVKYRGTSSAQVSPSVGSSKSSAGPSIEATKASASKGNVPKRGVSSTEFKEKQTKSIPDSRVEMKDESVIAVSKANNSGSQANESASLPSKSVIPRKPPGSGFRMGKSTSQDTRSDTTEGFGHAPPRRKPADLRTIRDKARFTSLPVKPSPRNDAMSMEGKVGSFTQPQRIRRIKESDTGSGGGGTDSEREKVAGHASELAKEKARTREHGVKGHHEAIGQDGTLKRKKTIHANNDSEVVGSWSAPQKKTKLEKGSAFTSSNGRESSGVDLSLPRKPELISGVRLKAKREHSPLQPMSLPKIQKDVLKTSLVTHRGRMSSHLPNQSFSGEGRKRDDSTTAKVRRRSPVYTSSEEEGGIRSPKRAVSVTPLPTPPMTTNRPSPATASSHPHLPARPRMRELRPLPTDHASLRARYSTSYLEYLSKFHKLVAQKGKIDLMLKNSDTGAIGSITDSDGEVELMDFEELGRLSSEYKVLEEELETIRNAFTRPESH